MGRRKVNYTPGDHLMVCDRSGMTFRRSEMVQEPKTGYWVHKSEVDLPHPQQYRTPISPDRMTVYPVRPRLFERTLGTGGAYPDGSLSALPQLGGGAIADAASGYVFLDTNDVDPSLF